MTSFAAVAILELSGRVICSAMFLVSLGNMRRTTGADPQNAYEHLRPALLQPLFARTTRKTSRQFGTIISAEGKHLPQHMFTPSSAEHHSTLTLNVERCTTSLVIAATLTTTMCPSPGPAASPWIHHHLERRADRYCHPIKPTSYAAALLLLLHAA
jgi:hypothetical protein